MARKLVSLVDESEGRTGLGTHTADDDIACRQALLEAELALLDDVVRVEARLVAALARLALDLAASELLDPVKIDREDARAVVGQERRERATDDLGSVDDRDGAAERARAVGPQRVVDLAVLEGLDNREGGAGEDGLDEAVLVRRRDDGRVRGRGDGLRLGLGVRGRGENLRRERELARVDEARVVIQREEPVSTTVRVFSTTRLTSQRGKDERRTT